MPLLRGRQRSRASSNADFTPESLPKRPVAPSRKSTLSNGHPLQELKKKTFVSSVRSLFSSSTISLRDSTAPSDSDGSSTTQASAGHTPFAHTPLYLTPRPSNLSNTQTLTRRDSNEPTIPIIVSPTPTPLGKKKCHACGQTYPPGHPAHDPMYSMPVDSSTLLPKPSDDSLTKNAKSILRRPSINQADLATLLAWKAAGVSQEDLSSLLLSPALSRVPSSTQVQRRSFSAGRSSRPASPRRSFSANRSSGQPSRQPSPARDGSEQEIALPTASVGAGRPETPSDQDADINPPPSLEEWTASQKRLAKQLEKHSSSRLTLAPSVTKTVRPRGLGWIGKLKRMKSKYTKRGEEEYW